MSVTPDKSAQEQAKEIEQYTEACARAADEIGRRMYVEDKLTAERDALKAEVERLRAAMEDEACSARRMGQLGIEQRLRAALRGEEAPRGE